MRKKTLAVALLLVWMLVLSTGVGIAKGPPSQPAIPIVDDELLPGDDVDGIGIQRGDGFVFVRLNRGGLQAHVNIILRRASFTDIWDVAGVNGLEDPLIPVTPDPDDGILEGDGDYGGCQDDAQIDFGASHIAKAQLYTCGWHDGFYLAVAYSDTPGAVSAIKFVFTDRGENTSDVIHVSGGGEYDANEWIPLEE